MSAHRLDDLGLEPAQGTEPRGPRERAIDWGPRYDFTFAGDWLARMHDAGADYVCLNVWVRLHASRDRHRRPPGEGTKDRSIASVIGTTRAADETERDHLARMGRQVELAFHRRRASVVTGPNVAGSYYAIAHNRNGSIPPALFDALESSPLDADRAGVHLLRARHQADLEDGWFEQ